MPSAALIVETLLGVLAISAAFQYFVVSLRNIPGPLLAKITNLWNLLDVWKGRSDVSHRHLHRKYGPAVQYGPGRTLFSARDEAWHTVMTKRFNKLYTMNSVLQFEGQVDETIAHLISRLTEEFVVKKKPYAWDVIGKVTFSRELGFLDQARDIDDLIDTGRRAIHYFSLISQMPFLDQLFDKNPVYPLGPPSFGAAAGWGAKQMYARMAGEDKHDPEVQADFLDLFLDMKKNDPDVDDNRIIVYLMSNVTKIAGSDTTAIELRAVLYFLCKHVECMNRLQRELDDAGMRNASPKPYRDVSRLPYLDAVIRESMRLHPAVGIALERIVPESGLRLPDGRFIPRNTVVGMNPMVINRDEGVYGTAPDEFKPERWLQQKDESNASFEERVHRMKESDLTFGYGKRMCSGRHVAIMEIYKVMATLFATFNVQLVEPTKEWKTQNSFFVRQWDMSVWLEPRG
ncbi:MAG: hypothetical protein Q9162_005962 [Coniocarpon cinnabarinum]